MHKESTGNALVVIFEWNDRHLVGKRDPDGQVSSRALPIFTSAVDFGFMRRNILINIPSSRRSNPQPIYICDTAALKAGICTEEQSGQVIVDTTEPSTVVTKALNFSLEESLGIRFVDYPVHKTGYYCVMTWPLDVNGLESTYSGAIEFNNNFGLLAGTDFPKLPVSQLCRGCSGAFCFGRSRRSLRSATDTASNLRSSSMVPFR